MNPVEQILKEIRKCGFRNEVFEALKNVVDRLCADTQNISSSTITSITARQ